jgi:hypothetical protein
MVVFGFTTVCLFLEKQNAVGPVQLSDRQVDGFRAVRASQTKAVIQEETSCPHDNKKDTKAIERIWPTFVARQKTFINNPTDPSALPFFFSVIKRDKRRRMGDYLALVASCNFLPAAVCTHELGAI